MIALGAHRLKCEYPLIEGAHSRPAGGAALSSRPPERGKRENRNNENVAISLTGSPIQSARMCRNLLEGHEAGLNLLIRARDPHEANCASGKPCSCTGVPRFYEYLQTRIRIFPD